MAFNLNKNETTNLSTKFDLSKNSSPTGVSTEQEKSKPKTWLWALLGILVIGITAWYFLSRSNDTSKNENDVASTATGSDSANIPAANTSAKSNTDTKTGNNTSTTPTTAISGTNINNKVPATFAKGSNSISYMDESLVKDIVLFLEKNPGSLINVNGYASSEGTLAVNQQISQSRADAFERYLISKGINRNRINATGKGIDNPISSNDTEEGRMKNRRVEISFQ